MFITIIGAGIGGLSLGIALKQRGIPVRIYEAASEIKVVGAGIILGCNAMQVYGALGLMDDLMERGNSLTRLSVTDHKLKNLSSISLDHFVEKHKVGNYAIHRADLQEVLLSRFEKGEVILNKRLINLDPGKKEIRFEDGEVEPYEILIGADGIHSTVRKHLFDKAYRIRSANQMCWRGVVDYQLDRDYRHEFREAWGKGCRIGHGQINNQKVYWFALLNTKESSDLFKGREWMNHFDGFDPLLKELLNNTKDEDIHVAPISDLQALDKWYDQDVCLIGDAAHAMTPNMGQGAGQSIEDAYALARFMAAGIDDIQQAFQEYQKYRYKKVGRIVKNSWSIGKLSQINSGLLIGIRNVLMKLTPESIGIKGMESTFEI